MRQRYFRGRSTLAPKGVCALGLGGLVVALVGGACGPREAPAPQPANTAAAPPSKVQASTVVVNEAVVPRFLMLNGTLNSLESSDVAAGSMGKIISTHVERGSWVKKGDVLARLDARVASANADEARAQLELTRVQKELAEAECERNARLFEGGNVSAADHQRVQAQCRTAAANAATAQARLNLSEANLSDTTIRAPFDGLVAERTVAVGEYVRADSRVITLLSTQSLRLELTVPESSAPVVQRDQEVEFTLTAHPEQVLHAKVTYVGPALRRGTRDLVVEALVPNPGNKLLPGQFATAKLRLGDVSMPVVPRSSIRASNSEARVFVVTDGRLEERMVQLGEGVGTAVGVLSGVSPGERVVATVSAELHDGALLQ
jgi:membrane fusion protein, multidrug efflux system